MAQQNLTQKMGAYHWTWYQTWYQNRSLSEVKSNWTTILPLTSEGELESGVPVRPLPAGPGGRAHRGLLGRDVGRHVQALLEGERRLDLLNQ